MKQLISYRRFRLLILVLTLTAAALRSLAFFTAFDTAVGYFDANVFSTLLYIVIALAVLLALAYGLASAVARKKEDSEPNCPDVTCCPLPVRSAAVLVALVLGVAALHELPTLVSGTLLGLPAIRFVCALCAIPYFVLPQSRRTLVFGLFSPLYCVLGLVTEYFDRYVTMNSPLKLLQQVAFLVVILYILAELSHRMGKHSPIKYTVLCALSVFFTLTNGISCIAGVMATGEIPADYFIHAVLLLSIGIYTSARLYVPNKTTIKEEI